MGRHSKPRARREDVEEVPDPPRDWKDEIGRKAAPEEEPEDSAPKVRRKVGRPRKVKVPVVIPPGVKAGIAIGPLLVAAGLARQFADTELVFDERALSTVVEAFGVWLDSINVELTPGWALLGAYAAAVGSADVRVTGRAKKPEPAPDSAPEPPHVVTDPNPEGNADATGGSTASAGADASAPGSRAVAA